MTERHMRAAGQSRPDTPGTQDTDGLHVNGLHDVSP
jgi:hypothetical protein